METETYKTKTRNRKAFVTALLASLLVASALAVPLIQVVVQQLGAGYADVLSPVNYAGVNHVFKIDNGQIYLDKVKITFDKDLPAGSYVRVELRDSSGNVLSSGEVTLQNDLSAGTPLVVDLSPDLDIYGIIQYSRIVVLVAGPEVTT